jgi:hypothetical protein
MRAGRFYLQDEFPHPARSGGSRLRLVLREMPVKADNCGLFKIHLASALERMLARA